MPDVVLSDPVAVLGERVGRAARRVTVGADGFTALGDGPLVAWWSYDPRGPGVSNRHRAAADSAFASAPGGAA